ncbi:MAG: phospholipase C, phosphocholine-specific [Verrucomicrobiales bacterium]|nr:phospholipase C, phosphocholine-specific [Verrucomicrobiales bacterium]
METRRDFVKKAMLLSGAAGWKGFFPESIARAMGIDPAPGSTYADAEHVVILMQENRSFDHCFGTLKGVRGFNDPRFISLPNGNPVWLQSNAAGETYAPFRFDIHGTKITWLGSTPHSRSSQVDAHNGGKYDRWLDVKKVGRKDVGHLPMTMGYYTREDVPFNYALADAFTVCDQNYCSAMTSTWPNRLYLWSGTIRERHSDDAKAYVRNEIPWGEARWTTFPEVLEKHGVSWKVYQNDLTAGGGFVGEERAWLSNFGCNPLEYLSQFNVRYSKRHVETLQRQADELPAEIAQLKATLATPLPDANETAESIKAREKALGNRDKALKDIAKKEAVLRNAREELVRWNRENFAKLSAEAKNLHLNAFVTNHGHPDCNALEQLSYETNGEKRELKVPKGDVLHQFREDVNNGNLPAVSWLVGPENFSDHPAAPWYGSWYVSEIIDILTKNPELWKKTIFIMTYDENDGYFDHIPPFTPPEPAKPATGKCSSGIDTAGEHIRREQELAHGVAEKEARGGPIGLGFRVPMIIASPWTRGGRVCSQVFDHTSVFRFVQDWLQKKHRKTIVEDTISLWRKTVCGDLTSAFRPFDPGDGLKLSALEKTAFIKGIHDAKFKPVPANFQALTAEQIEQTRKDPRHSPILPKQEPGVKPSCPLPYQLYADARLSSDKKSITLTIAARNDVFDERSAGSPFSLHFPTRCQVAQEAGNAPAFDHIGSRSYAVSAGGVLTDSLPLAFFENGLYHLRLHGPNGFFREHRGSADDPPLDIQCEYERSREKAAQKLTGNVELNIANHGSQPCEITITDHAYGANPLTRVIAPKSSGATSTLVLDQGTSHGWYDFTITVKDGGPFFRRFAGRVETGAESISDPFMGRVV